MGAVYLARDPDLDRLVALKVVRESLLARLGAEAETNLRREALAMARLRHPNVVAVHEVGLNDGLLYIAMEYIDGVSLDHWLTRSRPRWRAIVRVFIEAGQGLAAAHKVGIVHHDFKPSNVLIDRSGRVFVADFGIADLGPAQLYSVEQKRGGCAGERTNHVMGTPAYIAPEQLLGARGDPRSDQFSYCVALYQALFGELPFTGDRAAEYADSVLAGKIRRPSLSRVPRRLFTLIERGLARKSPARWPTISALVRELEALASRGHRRLLAFVCLLALFGMGVAVSGVFSAREFERCVNLEPFAEVWRGGKHDPSANAGSLSVTDRAEQTLALNAYRARWREHVRGLCGEERSWFRGSSRAATRCIEAGVDVLNRVQQTLGESDEALARASLAVADLPDPELVCNAGEGLVDPLQRAHNSVLLGARIALVLGRTKEALRLIQEQQKEAIKRGDTRTEGATEYELGRLFHRSGKLELAASHLERSLVLDNSNHRLLTRAYLALVESMRPGRKDIGRALVGPTMQELDSLRRHPILRARAYNDLGLALRRLGETAPALSAYQQAYELQLATLGAAHPEVAISRHNIGVTYKQDGRANQAREQPKQAAKNFEMAREQFEHALKTLENLPFTHPAEATVLGSLADTYDRLGQVDLAAATYQKAVERSQKIYGHERGEVVEAALNLGRFLAKNKRYEQAIEPLEHVLSMARAGTGSSDQEVFEILITLGYAHHKVGREGHACRKYRAALELEGRPQITAKKLHGARKQADRLCVDPSVTP